MSTLFIQVGLRYYRYGRGLYTCTIVTGFDIQWGGVSICISYMVVEYVLYRQMDQGKLLAAKQINFPFKICYGTI
jgi:hypothetical protein